MKYYMEKFDEFKFYKYNLEEFIQIIQQFWYYLYAMANTFFYFVFTIFRVLTHFQFVILIVILIKFHQNFLKL